MTESEADVVLLHRLPEGDGILLPADPYDAYANGAAKDIDLLMGCNLREMRLDLRFHGRRRPEAPGLATRKEKLAQLTDDGKRRWSRAT